MGAVKISEIIKVDSKGRITIPQSVREALNVEPGMLMVLSADLEKGEIIVNPITTKGEAIYEFDIYMVDRPGSLANVTEVFAKHGADIVATRCASIARGEEGSCTIVVDMSSSPSSAEQVKKELEDLDVVLQVVMKKFEGR